MEPFVAGTSRRLPFICGNLPCFATGNWSALLRGRLVPGRCILGAYLLDPAWVSTPITPESANNGILVFWWVHHYHSQVLGAHIHVHGQLAGGATFNPLAKYALGRIQHTAFGFRKA